MTGITLGLEKYNTFLTTNTASNAWVELVLSHSHENRDILVVQLVEIPARRTHTLMDFPWEALAQSSSPRFFSPRLLPWTGFYCHDIDHLTIWLSQAVLSRLHASTRAVPLAPRLKVCLGQSRKLSSRNIILELASLSRRPPFHFSRATSCAPWN